MKIAIIPARGGSQRIKRKNIKLFYGKPMIVWVIEKLINSNFFDKVVVSTDNIEIKNISLQAGADVPFIRPENLSDNYTTTVPVISHAVSECLYLGWNIETVCCVYPCSPFLKIIDIQKSYEILLNKNFNFVYPVVEYPHPIQRALKRSKNGQMVFKYAEYELSRTQDLDMFYHDAGQFYWGLKDAWISNKKMHTNGTSIVIPSWRVVDIDTEDDWQRAENIFISYFKKEKIL